MANTMARRGAAGSSRRVDGGRTVVSLVSYPMALLSGRRSARLTCVCVSQGSSSRRARTARPQPARCAAKGVARGIVGVVALPFAELCMSRHAGGMCSRCQPSWRRAAPPRSRWTLLRYGNELCIVPPRAATCRGAPQLMSCAHNSLRTHAAIVPLCWPSAGCMRAPVRRGHGARSASA